jgi:hypothetical protein
MKCMPKPIGKVVLVYVQSAKKSMCFVIAAFVLSIVTMIIIVTILILTDAHDNSSAATS